jgi:hypothetical protein
LEAKQAARDTGFDDNRSVLLKAAKQETPKAQVDYLYAEAQRREGQRRAPAIDVVEREFQRILKSWRQHLKVWDTACPLARERFDSYLRDLSEPDVARVESRASPDPRAECIAQRDAKRD